MVTLNSSHAIKWNDDHILFIVDEAEDFAEDWEEEPDEEED